MQERDYFAKVFMPISYILAVTGILLMAWQGVNRMEDQPMSREWLVLGQGFFLMPIPFFLFRFMRGHFSKRLKD